MPTITELRERLQLGLDNGAIDQEEYDILLARLDASAIGGNEDNVTTEPVDPWLEGFTPPARNDQKLLIAELIQNGLSEVEALRATLDDSQHPEAAAEKAEQRY